MNGPEGIRAKVSAGRGGRRRLSVKAHNVQGAHASGDGGEFHQSLAAPGSAEGERLIVLIISLRWRHLQRNAVHAHGQVLIRDFSNERPLHPGEERRRAAGGVDLRAPARDPVHARGGRGGDRVRPAGGAPGAVSGVQGDSQRNGFLRSQRREDNMVQPDEVSVTRQHTGSVLDPAHRVRSGAHRYGRAPPVIHLGTGNPEAVHGHGQGGRPRGARPPGRRCGRA